MGSHRLRWSVLERQQRRPQQIRLRIRRRHPPLEARAAGAAGPEPIAVRRERVRVAVQLATAAVRDGEAAELGVDAGHGTYQRGSGTWVRTFRPSRISYSITSVVPGRKGGRCIPAPTPQPLWSVPTIVSPLSSS